MDNILLPSKVYFQPGDRPHEAVLIVEPCYHGYGTTLGNALRRVLLSSLSGAAVTAIKMKGVSHEFQAIDGVKEDALDVILNMKLLRVKLYANGPVKLFVHVEGSKTVHASDIEPNADVEIVNPDLVLFTTTNEKTKLDLEIIVSPGRGYQPTEERVNESHDLGMITIDSLYSPIRSVGYRVEDTRVGNITNYDKLVMNIETDGTLTPQEAVKQASELLQSYVSLLTSKIGGGELDVDSTKETHEYDQKESNKKTSFEVEEE